MARGVHVTGHAISRYRKRVAPVSYDEARKALATPLIEQAAEIGASSVLLPSGHKAILVGNSVVTVRSKHSRKRNVASRKGNRCP